MSRHLLLRETHSPVELLKAFSLSIFLLERTEENTRSLVPVAWH